MTSPLGMIGLYSNTLGFVNMRDLADLKDSVLKLSYVRRGFEEFAMVSTMT